jgi:hypothetical protein
MHKTRADLHVSCDMGERPLARLLCYGVTKSLGCPLISATGVISFRERSPTRRTTKSSFVHDQRDLISPKLDISFHTIASIMDLSTDFSTSGARCVLFSGSYLHLNAFIGSDALAQNLEFGQIQGDDDPLVEVALSCPLSISGMLV